MRVDAFLVGFGLLFLSLLTFLFSPNLLVTDIAYIAVMVSMALLAFNDWIELIIMKVRENIHLKA